MEILDDKNKTMDLTNKPKVGDYKIVKKVGKYTNDIKYLIYKYKNYILFKHWTCLHRNGYDDLQIATIELKKLQTKKDSYSYEDVEIDNMFDKNSMEKIQYQILKVVKDQELSRFRSLSVGNYIIVFRVYTLETNSYSSWHMLESISDDGTKTLLKFKNEYSANKYYRNLKYSKYDGVLNMENYLFVNK